MNVVEQFKWNPVHIHQLAVLITIAEITESSHKLTMQLNALSLGAYQKNLTNTI